MSEEKTENEKIQVKVLGQDNTVILFKVGKNAPLYKLMKVYCERTGTTMQVLSFRFNGHPVMKDSTPNSLKIEHNDIIEVYQQQIGGGSN